MYQFKDSLDNILNDFWTFTTCHISDWGNNPLQPFHRKLCHFLDGPSKRKIVMLPRSSYKTTIGQLYKLYRMLKDSNISMLSATSSGDFAEAQVEELKAYIMADEIYKHLKSNLWRNHEFNISTRSIMSRDKTCMSAGINTKVTGKHPKMAFLDDVVDWQNSRTEAQRQKVMEWYNNVLYLVGDDGEIVYMCTPWHRRDLSIQLMEQENGYQKLFIPAVVTPSDLDVIKKDTSYESLMIKHSYPSGVPIWNYKTMENVENSKQELMGDNKEMMFFLQLMLTTSFYRKGAFAEPLFFDEVPDVDRSKRFVIVDPAFTLDEENCASAIWVVYVGLDGLMYVVDGIQEQLGIGEMMRIANTYGRNYGCEIYSDLMPHLRDINEHAVAHWNNIMDKRPKDIRILRLRDQWNRGRFRIRKGDNWTPAFPTGYGGLNDLIDAAKDYPYPRFLDGLDCLAHSIRLASNAA